MNQPLVFENGVHDISNDDYHSSSGISRSALWKFKRSPLHYWDSYLNPDRLPSEDTPALIMGNLIHTVVLEPDLFEKRYIVAPEINRRTKLGKQEWDDFLNAAGDRTVITQEQNDKAFEIAARCVSNAYFRSLIQGTEIERSIYFTHPATGIQCKVRPDSWINAVVTDLKTTADASYKGFQSSAVKYGYFLQAGMINYALKSIGITLEAFAFAVVETAEPYLTEAFR